MENQNRNNRVHTEEQPGKADFQIAELRNVRQAGL